MTTLCERRKAFRAAGWRMFELAVITATAALAVVLGGHPASAQSSDTTTRLVPWVSSNGRIDKLKPGDGKPDPAMSQPLGAPRVAQQQVKALPSAPAASPPGEPWAVNCSNRTGGAFLCEMTQAMVDNNSHVVVLLISISTPQGTAGPAILLRSMHGVYLPAGVALHVDAGKPAQLEFQKSDQVGVYAALPLTPPLIAELKRGRELVISMEINKGEKVELKALLQGFGPAFDRVVAKS